MAQQVKVQPRISNWYGDLVNDLQHLEHTGVVVTKHAQGKRILADWDKFGKPKYGSKTVETLAKDIGCSRVDIYRCIQFARQFPELSHGVKQLQDKSWRYIANKLLPTPKPKDHEKPMKAPKGTFDVVVVDPPWPMQKIERECRPNQTKRLDYSPMTIEQITEYDLRCGPHCHVWLWTTHRFLPTAFEILKEWGLKYVCTFVWHKPGGFQVTGLPQYDCEFALYARRGQPQFVTTKGLHTCFNGKRQGHSAKPDEFYTMVRKTTSGRRSDHFARRQIEGFVPIGKEAP